MYFMIMALMGNSNFLPLLQLFMHAYLCVNSSEVGRWNTRGVEIVDELSNETIVTCHSTHLTSFAVLVSPQGARPVSIPDSLYV